MGLREISTLCLGLAACQVAPAFVLTEVDRVIDGEPVPLDAFCPLFARAWCDSVEACACGLDDRSTCVRRSFDDCAGDGGFLGPEVHTAIDDGRIVYDEVAAAALIDRVASTAMTCDVLGALDWQMRDLLTFDGMLLGQLEPGAACSFEWNRIGPNECRDGACGSVGGGPLECVAVVGFGEACAAKRRVCVDLDRAISIEADLEGRGARCANGTCRPSLGVGGSCVVNADCDSTRCEGGLCLDFVAPGGSCDDDQVCASGVCDDGRCGARDRPSLAACGSNGDCAEGNCVQGVCSPAICDGYAPPPP